MTFAFHATHPSKENIVGFLMGGGAETTLCTLLVLIIRPQLTLQPLPELAD